MQNELWLEDLMDEYPTGRSDDAIRRIERIYSDYSATVMATAVKKYMLFGAQFFPKVGELLPFVEEAARVEMNTVQKDDNWRQAIDHKLLQHEQIRGTMRSTEEIGAEMAAAREQLHKMLAYQAMKAGSDEHVRMGAGSNA